MPMNEDPVGEVDDSEETAFESRSPPLRKIAWKNLLRLLIAVLIISAAMLLLNSPAIKEHLFDIEVLRGELQGKGWKGIALFMGFACLVNALGMPKLWVCAAAGTLFGVVTGGFSAFIACLAGAAINFLMGRTLLQGFFFRRMPARLHYWYNAFNSQGFRAILYMRLFPFTNATLTSVLGGASQIRFRDFFAATAIGYVPFTIIYTLLGSSAAQKNGWHLAGGVLLFVAVAAGQWTWSGFRKRGRNNTLASGIKADQIVEMPQQQEEARI